MRYSQRTRTERQISVVRLLLASFSLLVIYLDPAEGGNNSRATYLVGVGFAAYSVAVVLLVPRVSINFSRLQVGVHAVDIAVFSAFIYLTQGTTSLFFVYFVFTLITATLRWQWRGTLITAALILVAFLALGFLGAQLRNDPDFDLGRLMIGIVYLAVVAWLLAFLGTHEDRLRREVARLADWSRDPGLNDALGASHTWWLADAARAMGVQRAVFVWEDEQEPWLQIAAWEEGALTLSRVAADRFSPLVAKEVDTASFVCSDARGGPAALTLYGSENDLRRHRGPPIDMAFAERFGMGTVISARVSTPDEKARLFFLDRRGVSSDDLALVDIIAAGVTLLATGSHLRARLAESAAFEERVRLSRDLHDGVLQSLAGAAFQLETVRLLSAQGPLEVQEIIESVQDSLAQDQRDVRDFIEHLRPGHLPDRGATRGLHTRLRELAEGVSRRWGLDVELSVPDNLEEELGTTGAARDGFAVDIVLLVHEGLVNSARHSGGTHVGVTVRHRDDSVEIVLEDDGHGFEFEGRSDMASLRGQGIGPRMLIQRVESRGGRLTVESSARGSRIEIAIPAERSVADPREVL